MRQNTRQVMAAFVRGRAARPCPAIWTDGESVFSYGTCLVAAEGDETTVNLTRYSVTTTIHQNGILEFFGFTRELGIFGDNAKVEGVRIEASREDLLRARA